MASVHGVAEIFGKETIVSEGFERCRSWRRELSLLLTLVSLSLRHV